jgi:hypothetical protein
VVIVLIAFGVLGIFSIGMPFLLLGLVLAALGPSRRESTVFWPGVMATIAFILGFAVVTPLGCTASASVTDPESAGEQQLSVSHTTCSNALGIDYSGEGTYNPPLWPALVAGLLGGAMGGLATRSLVTHRGTQPNDNN